MSRLNRFHAPVDRTLKLLSAKCYISEIEDGNMLD